MKDKVKIEIESDHITVYHNDEEIVYWVDTEWNEDPSIVISIANAILLATTDIHELRRLVGKPLAKKTVKRLSKK